MIMRVPLVLQFDHDGKSVSMELILGVSYLEPENTLTRFTDNCVIFADG